MHLPRVLSHHDATISQNFFPSGGDSMNSIEGLIKFMEPPMVTAISLKCAVALEAYCR